MNAPTTQVDTAIKLTDPASPAPAPDIFALVDEPIIASLLSETIRRFCDFGIRRYDVTEIPQLIEDFRAADPRPRLLIVKAMGGLGVMAAQACREIEPGLKLIVMSGWLARSLHRIVTLGPTVADAVVGIPWQSRELATTVQRLLGGPRPAAAESTARPANTTGPAPLVPSLPRPAGQCPLVLFCDIFPYGRCVTGVPDEYLRALAKPCGDVSVYCGSLKSGDRSAVAKILAKAKERGHPVMLIASFFAMAMEEDGLPAAAFWRKIYPAVKLVLATAPAPEMVARLNVAVDAIVGERPTKAEMDEIRRQQRALRALLGDEEADSSETSLPKEPVARPLPDHLRAELKRLMVEMGCPDFDLTP